MSAKPASVVSADYNAEIIDCFRAHHGRVTGVWGNVRLLLLHHVGARSGARRVNPLGYLADEQRYLIFASNGGAPKNPDWYYNLMAHPVTRVEVGDRIIDVVAEEATGEDRERLFAKGVERFPQLADYARKGGRLIPVIVLTSQHQRRCHEPERNHHER